MANTTKVQPGLEAETAVIGALIYAPEIVKDVLFAVREQDFGIEINRKIFRAARDLYLRAKPVTAVTIRDIYTRLCSLVSGFCNKVSRKIVSKLYRLKSKIAS